MDDFEKAKQEAAEITRALSKLFDGKINMAISAAVYVQLISDVKIFQGVLALAGEFASPELQAVAQAAAEGCDCAECQASKAQEAAAH